MVFGDHRRHHDTRGVAVGPLPTVNRRFQPDRRVPVRRAARVAELLRRRPPHGHDSPRRRDQGGAPGQPRGARSHQAGGRTTANGVAIDANRRDPGWDRRRDNIVNTTFDIELPASASLDIDVVFEPARHSRRQRSARSSRPSRATSTWTRRPRALPPRSRPGRSAATSAHGWPKGRNERFASTASAAASRAASPSPSARTVAVGRQGTRLRAAPAAG